MARPASGKRVRGANRKIDTSKKGPVMKEKTWHLWGRDEQFGSSVFDDHERWGYKGGE